MFSKCCRPVVGFPSNTWPLSSSSQINNMKAKFKETLERCDNLERRLNDVGKEKQGMEKK